MIRFLYVGYVVGNEAVQILKLVLILFRAFMNFFCSDSNLKPIIYWQFTSLEFLINYSQQKLVWRNIQSLKLPDPKDFHKIIDGSACHLPLCEFQIYFGLLYQQINHCAQQHHI